MPWKECQVMDERLRFVARPLATDVCPAEGIGDRTLQTGKECRSFVVYLAYRVANESHTGSQRLGLLRMVVVLGIHRTCAG
jgi:hypothetical protein